MSPGVAAAVLFCAVGGLGGAVQVAVMGRLGDRIGVAEALAFATLLTALLCGLALLVLRQSLAGYAEGLRAPPWLWTGALMSAMIVFALTFAAPRIGSAATIGIIVGGNLVMGALIDQLGWFGLERIPLSWHRLLGVLLLGVGAALTLWRT